MIDPYQIYSFTLNRLRDGIRALCPEIGIDISGFGPTAVVTFRPDPQATANQITAAQNFITTFDWSDAATQAWVSAKEPLIKDFRDMAQQMLSDIDAYLAIADTATAAQVRAEVKAIDQRLKRLIKALGRVAELVAG